MNDTNDEERERFSGYHECPCCDEILFGGYVDEPLCDSCTEAGCEESEDACGEVAYWNCQIPTCPSCETRESFLNDKKWHHNCDDREACVKAYEEECHG